METTHAEEIESEDMTLEIEDDRIITPFNEVLFSEIRGLQIEVRPASATLRRGATLMVVIWVFIAFALALTVRFSSEEPLVSLIRFMIMGAFVAAGLWVLSGWYRQKLAPSYGLIITTADGELDLWHSYEREIIEEALNAVHEAWVDWSLEQQPGTEPVSLQ